jgi:hypothetical protein
MDPDKAANIRYHKAFYWAQKAAWDVTDLDLLGHACLVRQSEKTFTSLFQSVGKKYFCNISPNEPSLVRIRKGCSRFNFKPLPVLATGEEKKGVPLPSTASKSQILSQPYTQVF